MFFIELNDTYPLVTKVETTFHFILGLPLLIQVVDQLHIEYKPDPAKPLIATVLYFILF
jgi:hypothetical protein